MYNHFCLQYPLQVQISQQNMTLWKPPVGGKDSLLIIEHRHINYNNQIYKLYGLQLYIVVRALEFVAYIGASWYQH